LINKFKNFKPVGSLREVYKQEKRGEIMGKLIILTISIVLFSIFLLIIGVLFWDNADHSNTNQNNTITPNSTSVISGLRAMPDNVDDSKASAEDRISVAEANNKFAFDFYKEIKGEEGNLFYSPYSISSALAMTYEGAGGMTKEEMKEVFYFPEQEQMRNGYASAYNTINKKNKNYSLSTANALWAERTYAFSQDYFSNVEKYYGGRVTNMDFLTNSEQSRQTINYWVEEQTNNKIKNLLPVGSIDSSTSLVLTNAIYFKGSWKTEFKEENTRQEDFTSEQGTVKADMMHQKNDFNYAQLSGLKLLEMDYTQDLSMLIILPDKGLDTIDLTENHLNSWKSNMQQKEVEVYIPKFKFETQYDIGQNLADMGMPTAFAAGQADFSGMTGSNDLYISKVVHKAFVEVNEQGTEAAAATGVVIGVTSAGPDETAVFRADHPFIFIIQEKDTGNILFLGRIENPSE
jgi:serpin B